MELAYWPSDAKWELPSIDVDCLHILSYLKFSQIDILTTPAYKSLFQLKGRNLPALRVTENEVLRTKDKIMKALAGLKEDLDSFIAENDRIKILPFKTLIMDKLYPAVIATLWLDEANYMEVTRPLYARNCRYPVNFTAPKKLRDEYEQKICALKAVERVDPAVLKKLVDEAVSILQLFSEYLGNKDFLFGAKPSSADALLFACITPLLKLQLPTGNNLVCEAKKFTNLFIYTKRILQSYLKPEAKEELPAEEKEKQQQKEDSEEKYDWVFPVCVAGIAMFSYAVNIGLLENSK